MQTPVITSERRLVVEDRVELPRVYMAWITPPFFKEGDADADIAASILGQGRVSRLYKKLEYEKQIAQNVSAYQYSTMLGSVFGIEATARPGHTLQELETVINEEVELLRAKGPTAAEVERARNVLETQIFNGLQLVGGFGGVADQLNLYNHYVGKPDYLTEDIMRHRRVTPESVRQFAQRYLAPNARVVVHGIPGKQNLGPEVPKPAEQAATSAAPTVSINADEPWRAKQPGAGAAKAVRVPVPQSFELPNGLTVIALPQTGGVPVVSASLVLRSGGDANPVEKPGLASFTADVLDQGTTTRNGAAACRGGGADWRVAQHRHVARCHNRIDEQPEPEFSCRAGAGCRRRAASELSRGRSRARSCDAAGRSRRAARQPGSGCRRRHRQGRCTARINMDSARWERPSRTSS